MSDGDATVYKVRSARYLYPQYIIHEFSPLFIVCALLICLLVLIVRWLCSQVNIKYHASSVFELCAHDCYGQPEFLWIPIVTSTLDELWWQHCCQLGSRRRQPKPRRLLPKRLEHFKSHTLSDEAAALRAKTESLSNVVTALEPRTRQNYNKVVSEK